MGAHLSGESENKVQSPSIGQIVAPVMSLWEAGLSGGQMLRGSFFAEADRWFLWSPVLVGAGIALYFSLPFEPWLSLVWGLLALLALALFLLRQREAALLDLTAAALFCVVLGLVAATTRTALVSAPVLQSSWSGELTARIVQSEASRTGGLKVIVEPLTMQRFSPAAMPARLSLSIRIKGAPVEPGETVRLRARLLPPPEPVEPGGFDYARQIWFDRIGGTGFAYSAPQRIAPPGHGFTDTLERLRARISAHVRASIDGPAGAVAVALITGEKNAIPTGNVDDLRKAGLSHVLSISGLHMVLFAGSLFWLLRAGLALSPHLALHYPIKKWAAVIALVGATTYLLLSGAGIATQRAWVMISLMFVAILLDRPAISMRNVALAALAILIWQPESLLGASFHMSFAAVVALIAFYEVPFVQSFFVTERNIVQIPGLGPLRFLWRNLLGIAFTTTVAGLATGAYAAFHFDRIALYSMAGNLGAMPLVSIIIMPSALIALVLMPLGFDGPALWLMGKGIDGMLAIAHRVASWEGSDRLVAAAPMAALVAVTLGGLWLALWRTRWRFLGLAPIVLGLLMWNTGTRPDVLINRDGKLVAMRGGDGRLILSAARPAYAAGIWLRHDGDPRTPRDAASSDAKRCDALGCVWQQPGQPVIAMPKSLGALVDDCAHADIIVASFGLPYSLRKACTGPVVIDYFDLWRHGATTLTRAADGTWTRNTTRKARGDRPWVQQKKSRKETAKPTRAAAR